MTFHHLSEDVAFVGPPFSSGPLPAVFYFSLSAEESLCRDPFNQLVLYLAQFPIRIFSISLPADLKQWTIQSLPGHSVIDKIVNTTQAQIDFLIKKQLILENKLAVAGLSRGGFIATHVAARIPLFQTVLGFAPLIRPHEIKECCSQQDDLFVRSLALDHLAPLLIHHHLRFYVGNLDSRVKTRSCFEFITTLSQTALEHSIRSPQTELILFPSIGKDGHGTPREIFHQGAHWLALGLGVTHAM